MKAARQAVTARKPQAVKLPESSASTFADNPSVQKGGQKLYLKRQKG